MANVAFFVILCIALTLNGVQSLCDHSELARLGGDLSSSDTPLIPIEWWPEGAEVTHTCSVNCTKPFSDGTYKPKVYVCKNWDWTIDVEKFLFPETCIEPELTKSSGISSDHWNSARIQPFTNKNLVNYSIMFWHFRPTRSTVRTLHVQLGAAGFIDFLDIYNENEKWNAKSGFPPEFHLQGGTQKADTWNHISLTVSKKQDTTGAVVILYQNGVEVRVAETAEDQTILARSSDADGHYQTNFFVVEIWKGDKVAKVEVFDRALDLEAVKNLLASCEISEGLVDFRTWLIEDGIEKMKSDDKFGNDLDCEIGSDEFFVAGPPPEPQVMQAAEKLCHLSQEVENGSLDGASFQVQLSQLSWASSANYTCDKGYAFSDGNTSKIVKCDCLGTDWSAYKCINFEMEGCLGKWVIEEKCSPLNFCSFGKDPKALWIPGVGGNASATALGALAMKMCMPGYIHENGFGAMIFYKCVFNAVKESLELDTTDVVTADVEESIGFKVPLIYDLKTVVNLNKKVGTELPLCVENSCHGVNGESSESSVSKFS